MPLPAPWRAEALKTLQVPTRLVLAGHGEDKSAKPLYRNDPSPDALSPTVSVERIADADHLDMLWHPRTIAAIASFT